MIRPVPEISSLPHRQPPFRTVFTLTAQIQELLGNRFWLVWVEGEISQLQNHDSGNLYFSFKDEGALLKALVFRERAREILFPFKRRPAGPLFRKNFDLSPAGECRLIVNRIELEILLGEVKIEVRVERTHPEGDLR